MAKGVETKLGEASIGKNMRVYAVGDIHGCLRELKHMMKLIENDLKVRPVKKHRIIFLGDYVDRGPKSKDVIDYLIDLRNSDERVECLLGNHDEKVIRLTAEMDEAAFKNFIRYGGAETLKSYGFSKLELMVLRASGLSGSIGKAFRKTMAKRIPEDHVAFLRSLPCSITQGDYFFCHAGINPKRSLVNQKDHDLVWMREPFLSTKRLFEKVVIHGHTRQKEPHVKPNRINVDTSCCYGTTLTAVVLEGRKHSFLTVPAARKYWRS